MPSNPLTVCETPVTGLIRERGEGGGDNFASRLSRLARVHFQRPDKSATDDDDDNNKLTRARSPRGERGRWGSDRCSQERIRVKRGKKEEDSSTDLSVGYYQTKTFNSISISREEEERLDAQSLKNENRKNKRKTGTMIKTRDSRTRCGRARARACSTYCNPSPLGPPPSLPSPLSVTRTSRKRSALLRWNLMSEKADPDGSTSSS